MLEILILVGLGIAGGASWVSLSNAENKARNNAIKNGYRLWTDSKGRQRDTKTGRVLTIREAIGEPPKTIKKEPIKKTTLQYAVYSSNTSDVDIIFNNVKPLAVYENEEDAISYVKQLNKQMGKNDYSWCTDFKIRLISI